MSVYVDSLQWVPPLDGFRSRRRWRQACHLWADSPSELTVFAMDLGVGLDRFSSSSRPHYSLNPNQRRRAIAAGAIETTIAEFCAAAGRYAAASPKEMNK